MKKALEDMVLLTPPDVALEAFMEALLTPANNPFPCLSDIYPSEISAANESIPAAHQCRVPETRPVYDDATFSSDGFISHGNLNQSEPPAGVVTVATACFQEAESSMQGEIRETESPVPTVEKHAGTNSADMGMERRMRSHGAFRCVSICVNEVEILVPLLDLLRIIPFSQIAITALPGRMGWSLGGFLFQQGFCEIIDSYRLLDIEMKPFKEGSQYPGYVAILEEGRLALSCDEFKDVIAVDPENVCWQPSQERPDWVGGIVLKNMQTLLDVRQLEPALTRKSI